MTFPRGSDLNVFALHYCNLCVLLLAFSAVRMIAAECKMEGSLPVRLLYRFFLRSIPTLQSKTRKVARYASFISQYLHFVYMTCRTVSINCT